MAQKRNLIYESVLNTIKTDILTGKLKPGDRLPTVIAMADQLGVGAASVREAYRVLETLGVLEVTQGRGTFVSKTLNNQSSLPTQLEFLEKQSMQHLLESRKVLEPVVASFAAERATPDEVNAIVAAAQEMAELASENKDFIEPDMRFHELIFSASHNPVLAKMLFALSDLFLDSRRVTVRMPDATEKAIHYHKLIAIAIKERNAQAAHDLMLQHVLDVERGILSQQDN